MRFVAILCSESAEEEPLMFIWRLAEDPSGKLIWEYQCSTSLITIWASDRYRNTGMPQEVPALALLDHDNPNLVYCFLGDNIFSINVSDGIMVHFVQINLHNGLARTMFPPIISWRDVTTWVPHASEVDGMTH